MTTAYEESGILGLLWLLMWSAIPFYIVYLGLKDTKAREETWQEIKTDPVQAVLTVGILVGMAGWFLWLLSDGRLSHGGYSALIGVGSLFLAGVWKKLRGKKTA
ncbi:MAG: hypothetical protein Q8S00_09495 [Deltaproteobacteria bacterium]|nr:hypothetical protein [Deltaproteobacteria bacterium]